MISYGSSVYWSCVIIEGQQVDIKQQCLADKVPVVLVYTESGSWGSGVVLDHTEGIVLTCGHVVKSEPQGTVLYHRESAIHV